MLLFLVYFMSTLCFVLSDFSKIETFKALVGDSVNLPCNTSSPSLDDAISLIIWYKGNSIGLTLYSVDARNSTILTESKHFKNHNFKNRISFNLTAQNAFLTINNVSEEDDGEYRCRVDFRWARTINTIVRLIVIVPPNKLIIKDDFSLNLHESSNLYNEGSELKLTCIAFGGKPSPVIHWYSDNSLIDDTFSNKVDEFGLMTKNDLFIPKLTRKDLNKMITCVVTNYHLAETLNKTLILDMNLYPLSVKIVSIRRPLSADKTSQLECISRGSRPAARITWYIGNKKLTNYSEKFSTNIDETRSILNFTPSYAHNDVYLICESKNLRLPKSPIQDQWLLKIYYKPKVKVYSRSNVELNKIQEKDELIFECEIDSNPMIIEVGWLFNGAKLLPDVKDGLILENTTLVIKVIERKHSGNYSCYASNIEGKGFSQVLNLKVNHSPICITSHQNLYLTSLNASSQAICKVEAEPNLVTFSWKLNNKALNHDYNFSENELESRLNFSWSKFMEFGTLSCSAKNKIGNQLKPCLFTIIPSDIPDPLNNCVISNQVWNSISLTCEPGFNGDLNQTFNLNVFDHQKVNLLFNLSRNDTPTFIINNLTSSETYILDVFSTNLKGNSNITSLTIQTIAMQKQQFVNLKNGDFRSYLIMFISICLVFLMASVVTILILIIRNRHKKREKKTKSNSLKISSIDCKEPDVVPPQFSSFGKPTNSLNCDFSIPEMVADLNLLDSELKQTQLENYQLGVITDLNPIYCLSKMNCDLDDYGFTQIESKRNFQKKSVNDNQDESDKYIPISTQV